MTATTKRFLLLVAFLLAAVPFLLWAAFTIIVPWYVAARLLPSLATNHGISTLQARPVLVGRTGIHGGFSLGSQESPVLHVSSVDVDYSLGALVTRQEIEKISLSGVEIRCRFSGNRLLVDDAELQLILDALQQKPAAAEKGSQQMLPIPVKQISIQQATLICRTDTQILRLPFAVDIDLRNLSAQIKKLSFVMKLFPREQEIHLAGEYDLNARLLQFTFAAHDLNPRLFADFASFLAQLPAKITLDLNGTGAAGMNPFSLAELQGSAIFNIPQIEHRDFSLTPKEASLALYFKAVQPGAKQPLQVALTGSPYELTIQKDGTEFHIASPSFSVKGSLEPERIDITSRCSLSLSVKHDAYQIKIPQFAVNIETTKKPEEEFHSQGDLVIDGASMTLPSNNMQIRNSHLFFPFSWPYSIKTKKGKVACDAILWQDKTIGRFNGQIGQQEKNVTMTGGFQADFLKGLKATTKLSADFANEAAKIALTVDLPLTRLKNFSPKNLFPAAEGIVVSGQLGGSANVTFENNELTGKGQIAVKDGAVELAKQKTAITGIETEINFPNLPLLRSAPNQKLSFSRANLADLQVDGGMLNFGIESPESFFLEKATFNWADGTISTYAMRFSEQHLQPEMVFYCSKLKLAAILAQAGIKNVEGEGTVNGRIPIFFTDKTITFEQSFLYSTPGEGGVIRIGGGDFLTQAIPLTNPQFGQLDFAQEALRNFSYNWAKLHLFSENETLVMQLNLDGKPASPVPFSYDSRTGGFRRLAGKDGRTAGISHPIVLDVNFRFPLNTFLGYDKSIKEFFRQKTD